MPINQGLKAFAESTPDFDNQSVQNMINLVNTGWVEKTRTLAQKVDANLQRSVEAVYSQWRNAMVTKNYNLGKLIPQKIDR